MLQKKYIPRDKLTLDVIRQWVRTINDGIALQQEDLVDNEQIEALKIESKMNEKKEKEEGEEDLAFKNSDSVEPSSK